MKTKQKKWISILSVVLIFTLALSCFPVTAFAFNANIDYSAELSKPGLTPAERQELEQARQDKIDSLYGGKEPPLDGSSDGTKFSDIYNKDTGTVDFGSAQNHTNSNSVWNDGSDDELTEYRNAEVGKTLDQAVKDGKITAAEAQHAKLALKMSQKGGGTITADDPAVGTLLEAMGMENNFVNRQQATATLNSQQGYTEVNGTSCNLVDRYGNPVIYEGGKAYIKKDGKWVVDTSYDQLPNAVDLTPEQLDEIYKYRDQWDKATSNEEKLAIHEELQQIRDNIGYDGGFDGSFFGKTPGINSFGGSGGGGYNPGPGPNPGPDPRPEPDPTYRIIASAGRGGSISSVGTTYVKKGENKSYTMTPDVGYKIKDVLVDGVSIGVKASYDFNNVRSNHTISVTFEAAAPIPEAQCIITATAGEGGSISPAGKVSVPKHEDSSFVFNPDNGYEVDQVIVDSVEKAVEGIGYTFKNVVKDHTIHVTFKKTDSGTDIIPSEKSYVITATAGKGGSITPAGKITVPEHDDSGFSFNPDNGYVVDTVLVDGKAVTAESGYIFKNVTVDHEIEVTFKKADSGTDVIPSQKSYTIIATAGEGGSISPDGTVMVEEHADKSFVAKPKNGYKIKEILVDGQPVNVNNKYTFKNVVSNHTIHVTFEAKDQGTDVIPSQKSYTIIPMAGKGGTISPSTSVTVEEHGNKTFIAKPDSSHVLDQIIVDGKPVKPTGPNSYTFSNVTANHTIKVTFKEKDKGSFIITVIVPDKGGDITPGGDIEVNEGDDFTVIAKPDADYVIGSIIVDGKPVKDDNGSFTIEDIHENHTITVSFVTFDRPEGSLVITVLPSIGGTVDPNGDPPGKVIIPKNKIGTSIEFIAKPDEGYRFYEFLVDGREIKKADGKYSFLNIVEDHTIQAVFKKEASIDEIIIEPGGPGFENGNMDANAGTYSWITKSGYGVNLSVTVKTTEANVTKVTAVNSATGHKTDLEYVNGKWVFPENPDSKNHSRVEYIPVETKDGSYNFKVEVTAEDTADANNKIAAEKTASYEVKGSMYEDDFTGDRK